MGRHFVVALKLALVTLVLTGIIYPLGVTWISQILFPRKANGSLLQYEGKLVGSELIGQFFEQPHYFHPRPSAAGSGYDAASSSGSNLGPTSAMLMKQVSERVEKVLKENPGLKKGEIPVDMVTSSGSGLDPHISLANAYAQAGRVASARKLPLQRVAQQVQVYAEYPWWGFLGEPRVNVLRLNLALHDL